MHPHVQVLIGLDGCLDLDVQGRAARVDANSGLAVPAGMRHAYGTRHVARMLVIDAPAGALPVDFTRPRSFACPPGWRSRHHPTELLHLALHAPRVLTRRQVDVRVLEDAVQMRLHEDWSTARMAALYALSPQRFHARFVSLIGRTPQAWLRERRLQRAEALRRAGCTLEAAALQVGYRTASALCFARRRDGRPAGG